MTYKIIDSLKSVLLTSGLEPTDQVVWVRQEERLHPGVDGLHCTLAKSGLVAVSSWQNS